MAAHTITDTLRFLSHAWTPLPAQAVFFVTDRCPKNCPYCFFSRFLNKNKELTLEEYVRLSRNLRKLHLFQATLTGGEPFIREDLPDIVEALYRHADIRLISIPTSGWSPERISKSLAEIFHRCPLISINISLSLDGLRPIHDSLQNHTDSFDRVQETYHSIKRLARGNRLRILISTLMDAQNADSLQSLFPWVAQHMPKVSAVLLNAERGPRSRSPSRELLSLYGRTIETARQWRHLCNFPSRLETFVVNAVLNTGYGGLMETWRRQQRVLPCLAGRKFVAISPEGEVYPCEPLWFYPETVLPGGRPAYGLGRLADFDFDLKSLLEREEIQSLVRGIHKKGCFCEYPCALLNGLYLRPWEYGFKRLLNAARSRADQDNCRHNM